MKNGSFEKVDKKYSMYNSYFKNRKESYPDSILDIVLYEKQHNELPFIYQGNNWIYDAMIERQKRKGVVGSQYMTPDAVVEQIGNLTDSFHPEGMNVLNACCGIGQLTGCLLQRGFNVEGFDGDGDLVEICKIIYPNGNFLQMDFRGVESDKRWDLIIANPPHEQKLLKEFMEWLSTAMSADGKAILIMPSDYMKKDKPSGLVNVIKYFETLYDEPVLEPIPFTSTKNTINIIGLSEEYKNQHSLTISVTRNDFDEVKETIQQEEINTKQIEIMETNNAEKTYLVPLDRIKPNRENPRRKIIDSEIQELASSIKQSGLLQSIILRKKEDFYEIVCGERRYLAFIKNGQETIPAYIRDLSDEQVMKMALAENLQRKSLAPMEESDAFLKMIETCKYTVEDLMVIFGKTEAFIRGRLKLQNLTDNFKAFLDNECIVLGVALEIARYDSKTQKTIFKEHFINDDTTNWQELGVKEIAGKIERIYTTDLSKYSFDKKECEECPSNTGTYSLFANPGSGRCTDSECLNRKKTTFTVDLCDVVAKKYNSVKVCITPYDKLDVRMQEKLQEKGIDIITTIAQDFPAPLESPVREVFKSEEDYKEAVSVHKVDVIAYNHEMDELEEKVLNGEIQKVVYIGDNNPKLCYIPVKGSQEKDPVKALQEEDEVNKRQAQAGVIKELGQLIKTCELPVSSFSAFEEEMVFYFMLDSLNVKHYPMFGIKDTALKCLPDDVKYKISKSLTVKQKSVIHRDFIIRHLSKAAGSNANMTLLLSFARQHFLQETEDISRKYTESYNTKYQKIKKRIDGLSVNKEEIII